MTDNSKQSCVPTSKHRVWIAMKGNEESLRLAEADGWEVHEVAKAPACRPNSPEDIRQSMDLLQHIHRDKSTCDVHDHLLSDGNCNCPRGGSRVETSERQLPPHDYTHPDWQGNGVTKFWTEDSLRAYSAVSSSSPEEPPPERRETGWLVEDGAGHARPRFRTMDQTGIHWTDDANKALRFARRADAEMFAAGDEDAWRVTQHQWVTVDGDFIHAENGIGDV